MKHTLIVLFLTFNIAYGQNRLLPGKYISGEDYVIVSDSTVEFRILYGCCMPTDLYGYGHFKIQNESLYVATGKPSERHRSSYEVLNNLSNPSQLHFKVRCNGKPVEYCGFYILDKSKDQIGHGGSADSLGVAQLDDIKVDSKKNEVLFLYSGSFDEMEIPLHEIQGKSIQIDLVDHQVLHDREVAFKLLYANNSTELVGPFVLRTKNEIKKSKSRHRQHVLQSMVRTWPWKWRFKDTSHIPTPKNFKLQ